MAALVAYCLLVSSTTVLFVGAQILKESQNPNYCEQDIKLSLNGAGIRRLPAYFIQSSSIERLEIKNNDIESISKYAFAGMPNLAALSMEKNKLDLHQFFHFACENLVVLKLSNNERKNLTLPAVINIRYFFPKLKFVSIRYANINRLNEAWEFKLPQLATLYADGNPVDPEDFFRFLPHKLTILTLKNCSIVKLGNATFPWLRSLDFLDLSQNKFRKITNNPVIGPRNGELNLFYPFENKLTAIYLTECEIEVVEDKAFKHLLYLENVDLSHNKIRIIHYDTIQFLKGLRYWNLTGNLMLEEL